MAFICIMKATLVIMVATCKGCKIQQHFDGFYEILLYAVIFWYHNYIVSSSDEAANVLLSPPPPPVSVIIKCRIILCVMQYVSTMAYMIICFSC